jgi:hypothetical protein
MDSIQMHRRKRIERDALIIKLMAYGAALAYLYFALEGAGEADPQAWAKLGGAIAIAGLGHLVGWAITRFPKTPKQE